MEALSAIKYHYNEINERLNQLSDLINELEDKELTSQQLQALSSYTNFVHRDIKNLLRVEEEVLSSMRKDMNNNKLRDIQNIIDGYGVLNGALDQFVYGVKTESKPDIMESAKSILKHFPRHIQKVDRIAEQQPRILH
jgi:chromosome segregation ATPase